VSPNTQKNYLTLFLLLVGIYRQPSVLLFLALRMSLCKKCPSWHLITTLLCFVMPFIVCCHLCKPIQTTLDFHHATSFDVKNEFLSFGTYTSLGFPFHCMGWRPCLQAHQH